LAKSSDYGRVDLDPQDYNETGVAFYTALAQETGGPVLDIACGSGRVGIPIARLGFAVTGVDIQADMIELARSKSDGLPVRWLQADGRTFDLGEQFRLVMVAGNAFQMFLTNADQGALLERVRAHLADEGLFAFETRNPLWRTPLQAAEIEAVFEQARLRTDLFMFLETRIEEQLWQTYVDSKGIEIREYLTQTYDSFAQILHLTNYHRWMEGNEERLSIGREAVRFNFPQELSALLHYNGFDVIRQYGDWDLGPLSAVSTSVISVCRKRPASVR
jgi:SAM-dependent methyltransferase